MTQFTDVPDGARIAYTILNPKSSNTPLVMINGLTSIKEDFYPLCEDLAKFRPVLILDNRGMGESTAPREGRLTSLVMAEDTLAVIRSVGWKKLNLLGFSMGGMIAQTLMVNLKDSDICIEKVVLCSTSPAKPNSEKLFSTIINFMQKTQGRKATPEEVEEYVFRSGQLNYTSKWIEQNKARFEERVRRGMKGKRPKWVIMNQNFAVGKYNVIDQLSSLATSTSTTTFLVLHGDGDEIVPIAEGEKIAELLGSKATFVRLPEVGHMFFEMEPRSANIIEMFLEGWFEKAKL